MGACEQGEQWEEVLVLLQEMIHQFLTPNVLSLSTAISAQENGQQWNESLGLLQEMMHQLLTLKVVS